MLSSLPLGELLADAVSDVIALGGGTPMVDNARDEIEAARSAGTAMAVYLRCDVAELQRRLTSETADRPSLTGADPVHEVAVVMETREPVFRQLADHEYDATTASPEQAAASLERLVDPSDRT